MTTGEDPGLDGAVEEAMDKVRESYYLSDRVTRSASLEFLESLQSRLLDLYEELAHETAKHGDG